MEFFTSGKIFLKDDYNSTFYSVSNSINYYFLIYLMQLYPNYFDMTVRSYFSFDKNTNSGNFSVDFIINE